jgi:hypothetical protein
VVIFEVRKTPKNPRKHEISEICKKCAFSGFSGFFGVYFYNTYSMQIWAVLWDLTRKNPRFFRGPKKCKKTPKKYNSPCKNSSKIDKTNSQLSPCRIYMTSFFRSRHFLQKKLIFPFLTQFYSPNSVKILR